MKTRYHVVLILGALGFTAVVAYKTGRGARGDADQNAILSNQRIRILEEQLDVILNEWGRCIQGDHVVFPGDTALKNISQ